MNRLKETSALYRTLDCMIMQVRDCNPEEVPALKKELMDFIRNTMEFEYEVGYEHGIETLVKKEM